MGQDIIINGISINELAKQRVAIQKGASKIISDKIGTATSLTKEIVDCEDTEEIDKLATQALEALETAQLVSNVSGVNFYLPFYDEYGDNETYSSMLENSENEALSNNSKVNALAGLFYNMESQSEGWHSSRC